jgi:hypothetical protein
VPLVQPPAVDDRQPHLVEPVERDPERANRALQHRRVGEVEGVATVLEQLAGGAGFFAAAFGQIDVGPAGEAVFLVPDALAVAEQYECRHGSRGVICQFPVASCQFVVSSCQSGEATGRFRQLTGYWKLETGNWLLQLLQRSFTRIAAG